jgi:hypothetical protein
MAEVGQLGGNVDLGEDSPVVALSTRSQVQLAAQPRGTDPALVAQQAAQPGPDPTLVVDQQERAGHRQRYRQPRGAGLPVELSSAGTVVDGATDRANKL